MKHIHKNLGVYCRNDDVIIRGDNIIITGVPVVQNFSAFSRLPDYMTTSTMMSLLRPFAAI